MTCQASAFLASLFPKENIIQFISSSLLHCITLFFVLFLKHKKIMSTISRLNLRFVERNRKTHDYFSHKTNLNKQIQLSIIWFFHTPNHHSKQWCASIRYIERKCVFSTFFGTNLFAFVILFICVGCFSGNVRIFGNDEWKSFNVHFYALE